MKANCVGNFGSNISNGVTAGKYLIGQPSKDINPVATKDSCAIAVRVLDEQQRKYIKLDGSVLILSTPTVVTIQRNSSLIVTLPVQMRPAMDRHTLEIVPCHHRVEVVTYEPGSSSITLHNKMKQRAVTFSCGAPLLKVTLKKRTTQDPYLRPL